VLNEVCISDLELWLPLDSQVHPDGLSSRLTASSVNVRIRHLPLPVLRRNLGTPLGVLGLMFRCCAIFAILLIRKRRGPVYVANSSVLALAPIARILGYRHVLAHIQEVWRPEDQRVLKWMLRCSTSIVCNSEHVRTALDPENCARAMVIHNAVEDLGPPEPFPPPPIRFLMASRWTEGKGYGTLFDALESLPWPRRILIAGSPPDVGTGYDVVREVERHPRADQIEVVGEVVELAALMDECHAILLPSDYPEGFGLIAVEAFRRGRPVIGTSIGGLTEVVTNGKDGLLVPAGDSRALSEAMTACTLEELRSMGSRSRQTFDDRFRDERFASELLEWIRSERAIES
jgi:glycosyltransferase involved in cell wall biosynthesis